MPSFAADIRLLFRDEDIDEMRFAFDLSSYDDVKSHAEGIYARILDETMPCDGAWPKERMALFRQWIDDGCAP